MLDHSDNYYQNRLEDISLLDKALEIKGQILVPVGGKRVRGCCYYRNEKDAKEALNITSKLDGFPNPRIKVRDFWGVIWGEEYNENITTKELGRMYGYKESVLF
jgi:hypothetical protein